MARPAHRQRRRRDPEPIDRLSIRVRPGKWPFLYQRWEDLLFLHWPVSPDAIRSLLPDSVELDLWNRRAWVSITPFRATNMRPPLLPAVPLLSSTHEVNVRTYVHVNGVPGIWFLSIDANNPFAVALSRIGFALPYHLATMHFDHGAEPFVLRSARLAAGRAAALRVTWRTGKRLPEFEPGTLEFFLVERYCFYTTRFGRLWRGRIWHRPWRVRAARVEKLESTLLAKLGIDVADAPLAHAQAEPFDVEVHRFAIV
jgi:uncharacterized protein YqjF (DUF2071 family)